MNEVEFHRNQAAEHLREAARGACSDDAHSVVLALTALTHAVLALSAPGPTLTAEQRQEAT